MRGHLTISLAMAAVTAPAMAIAAGHVRLPRTVASLNEAAFAEAQSRDETASRAFSNVQIVADDGRCLFVDPLSGDFRANLDPIQLAACDSTAGQGWDVLTSGVHDNLPGVVLFVNTLTQACLNFDPRRRAGNQVLMFACGGRADGSGHVTPSQLFAFPNPVAPGHFNMTPQNALDLCFTAATTTAQLDITPCSPSAAGILFSIGNPAGAGPPSTTGIADAAAFASPTSAAVATTFSTLPFVSVSVAPFVSPSAIAVDAQTTLAPLADNALAPSAGLSDPGFLNFNPSVPTPVSGAGAILDPTAAAQSHQVHNTDTRALESVELVAANNQCLAVNPLGGDFRQNLIPVQLVKCQGAPNEKWDFITTGVHNDQNGTTLIVSSLTNGCISFDDRRAPGNKVTIFSCGGRGDGTGQVDAPQLFPFSGQTTLSLSPVNTNGKTCLVPDGGVIDATDCSDDTAQQFRIVNLVQDLP